MSRTNDIIFIDNTKKKNKTKLWCNICSFVLITGEDIISAKENGCCEECWMKFGQSRKKEWKLGWRPDKETIKRYKLERSILNVKLKDIIGD